MSSILISALAPERLHRIEHELGSTIYRAAILGGITRGAHRALTRDEAIDRLAHRGFPPIESILEFEDIFGGLDVCGLRLGLDATREFDACVSHHRSRGAVPIGTGPPDAVYWMDDAGGCYDDTDLEWCVPIGPFARGLLGYWLVSVEKSRWCGVVHAYIAQLEAIGAEDLAALLDTTVGGIAVGPTAVWSERATRVTDTLPRTRSWSAGATFSAPDVTSFVDVLRTAAAAHPDPRLYLVQPSLSLPAVGGTAPSVMRLRCVNPADPSRDDLLSVISDGPGYRLELVRV